MKKLVAFISALAISSSLMGGQLSAAESILTLAGAGPQGRWFKEVSVVGKVLTDKMGDVAVNGVIGKGVSVGNIKRIGTDRIDGGRAFLADLLDAYANKGQFDDGRNYKDVVAWFTVNPLIFRLIADKSIKSYADLKGKTVAIGARNSGDDVRAKAILAAYGITEKNAEFQYLGRSDAQNALANHQVDALLIAYSRNNRGHLAPVFAARPLGTDVHFVHLDEEVTRKFLEKNKAFYLDTLGEPVFGEADLKGIAIRTGFVIDKDVPEELVYKMTKTIFENWDEILQLAPWWKEKEAAGLDVAASFTAVPYHPGAEKYYRERGVWETHRK